MTDFWKQLAARAAPYVVAVLVAGGWFALYIQHQREIGRRDLLLDGAAKATAAAAHERDSVSRVAAGLRRQLTSDSADQVAASASLGAALARARLALQRAPAPSASSIPTTAPTADAVPTLRDALADLIPRAQQDSAKSARALNSCYSVVRNCAAIQRADSAQIHGLQQQLHILSSEFPSPTRQWAERGGLVVVGLEIGCLVVQHRFCWPQLRR